MYKHVSEAASLHEPRIACRRAEQVLFYPLRLLTWIKKKKKKNWKDKFRIKIVFSISVKFFENFKLRSFKQTILEKLEFSSMPIAVNLEIDDKSKSIKIMTLILIGVIYQIKSKSYDPCTTETVLYTVFHILMTILHFDDNIIFWWQ